MKKIVVSFVAGLMVATAGTSFAASGLIGQKVDEEVKVVVDGITVSNGIVIDGKSYAPTRDILESSGYDVSYSKGVVTATMAETANNEVIETFPEQPPKNVDVKLTESDIKMKIKSMKQKVGTYYIWLAGAKDTLQKMDNNDPGYAGYTAEQYAEKEAVVTDMKAKIETANAEVTKLQTDYPEYATIINEYFTFVASMETQYAAYLK